VSKKCSSSEFTPRWQLVIKSQSLITAPLKNRAREKTSDKKDEDECDETGRLSFLIKNATFYICLKHFKGILMRKFVQKNRFGLVKSKKRAK